MKQKILILLSLLLMLATQTFAQQFQELKRSKSSLMFTEFQDVKVVQPFGKYIKTKGNIFYKDGSFLFLQDGKIMQADTRNVISLEFDSLTFRKVDNTQMGRVVASKGYNFLLCVRTINMRIYSAETNGKVDHDYLDLNEMGMFLEIDGESQKREYDQGFPLQDKYYFSIQGKVIPANESQFKKYVKPEMKKAFKRLMNDHLWSWKDPASLAQLFVFLE